MLFLAIPAASSTSDMVIGENTSVTTGHKLEPLPFTRAFDLFASACFEGNLKSTVRNL
jgi:hypothetical protein